MPDADSANLKWPELIEAARNGCNDALGKIVEQVKNYLLLVADHRLQDGLRAKFGASDVVQQSLLEAQAEIRRFNGSSESEIRIWLKRIVLHNLIDETRRYTTSSSKNVAREISLDNAADLMPDRTAKTASTMMLLEEADVRLMQAISRLPARQRRVVEARQRFGYSYAQIAEQLDISEGAVRTLWSRATDQLRQWLDDRDG